MKNLAADLFHKLYPTSNFYSQNIERQRKFEQAVEEFLEGLKL